MPDVTKRLLTDETGQSIVTALGALTNVVDPNGTTVAAAQKLNNMTVSATVLPAGATPTSSLTEVNGHFHLTLGVPVELPTVDSNDDGKFLMVEDGAWSPVSLGEGGGLMSDEEKEKLDNLGEIDIYKTTEAASIASVTDGADGMPMRSVVVDIEPVQDLHGYDSPWPAGGGKNKFDETIGQPTANMTINGSGAESHSADRSATVGYTPVSEQTQYTISYAEATMRCGLFYYASDKTFISLESWALPPRTFTTPSNAAYVRFSFYEPTPPTKIQLETGSSATSWTPYSNICPISGWTGCKVTRAGKNLLNASQANEVRKNGATAYTLDYLGDNTVRMNTSTVGAYYVVWEVIKVAPHMVGESITFQNDENANIYICKTGKDGSWASTPTTLPSNTRTVTFTDDDVGRAFGYGFYNASGTTKTITHAQVEFGTTASAYEPFKSQTYNISWQSSSGTVYGGTLDAVTGKLVVDRACNSYDLFTITYSSSEQYGVKSFFKSISSHSTSASSSAGKICSHIGMYVYGSSEAHGGIPHFYIGGTTVSGYLPIDMPETGTIDFVYPLASPVEVTLDPTAITTLLGINNVYADCGNTAITYPTETTGLISTYDKVKIDTIPTKVSQLQNDSGYINSNPEMTGATSEDDGTSGLVPAPSAGDEDKFLSGDGTYKSGGLPMVILSYGSSTWSEFINAYNNNVIVYCRASSNANPATGSQTRMAFMAYVNDTTNPTNVEFQYYRSMNPNNKSISQMSDQIFVYKLASSGTWSVETREASLKSVVFDASSGLTGTFDKTTGTLTIAAAT